MALKDVNCVRIDRRKVLGTLGALTLVGYNGGSSGSNASSAGSGSGRSLSCVVTPSATEGPYFVDEGLNRSDLTSGTTRAAVLEGLPLALQVGVYRVSGSACSVIEGAQVDVWHADTAGVYSDVAAQNTVGQAFLRGYQLTDSSGAANFATIYPGWYPGRTTHIHFKVRSGNFEFTSQWFMDDKVTDVVYAASPYGSHGSRNRRNGNDRSYKSSLLLTLARDSADVGYVGTFTLGLQF